MIFKISKNLAKIEIEFYALCKRHKKAYLCNLKVKVKIKNQDIRK